MKKPETTITLNFAPSGVNIDYVRNLLLNDKHLINCGAETVRIVQQINKLIVEFYDIKDKKRISKQIDLLLRITSLTNALYFCYKKKIELISQIQAVSKDCDGTRKQLQDLIDHYNKFVNNEH